MQQTKQAVFRQYVLAGNTLTQKERIAVSSHVNLENPGEQDTRDLFIAERPAREAFSISMKWATVFFAVCIILCMFMIGSKIALTQALHAEYAQLEARYNVAQAEYRRLEETFAQKSDASGICYYAVQALGMRLAGNAETIGVQAAAIPFTQLPDRQLGSASNGR
ncbi:MAG: hypothetical protein GX611_01885 [Clostridiales bacterium]|mgnify:CR=1 FL=1|nr:hypothetical protein [Clostridiales bacterium]